MRQWKGSPCCAVAVLLLALGLLIALGGCLRVEMEMEISQDETISGTTVTWTRDLTASSQEPMRAISKDSGGAVRSGADSQETERVGSEQADSKPESESVALVATGVGLGGGVLLLALIGMGIGVTRALRG